MKEIKLSIVVKVDPEDYFGSIDEHWEEDFVEDVRQALIEMGGVKVTQIKKRG